MAQRNCFGTRIHAHKLLMSRILELWIYQDSQNLLFSFVLSIFLRSSVRTENSSSLDTFEHAHDSYNSALPPGISLEGKIHSWSISRSSTHPPCFDSIVQIVRHDCYVFFDWAVLVKIVDGVTLIRILSQFMITRQYHIGRFLCMQIWARS